MVLSVGMMNVHLTSVDNRSRLSGIVDMVELDVVVVVETFFEVGSSNKLMGDIFGNGWNWFGRERDYVL